MNRSIHRLASRLFRAAAVTAAAATGFNAEAAQAATTQAATMVKQGADYAVVASDRVAIWVCDMEADGRGVHAELHGQPRTAGTGRSGLPTARAALRLLEGGPGPVLLGAHRVVQGLRRPPVALDY
jgi:hypothetical protein